MNFVDPTGSVFNSYTHVLFSLAHCY
uniref:Uncharacterized protein n=1 Tax=Arundo donax TaxID=35708 RepID=A0A0A9AJ52_ARUDO